MSFVDVGLSSFASTSSEDIASRGSGTSLTNPEVAHQVPSKEEADHLPFNRAEVVGLMRSLLV